MVGVQLGLIPQIDNSMSPEEKENALDEIRQLEKAHIVVMEECTIECGEYEEAVVYEEEQIIPAQFNPTTYTISLASNFDDEFSGIEQNTATFGVSGAPAKRKLQVELLYDTMFTVDYLDKMQDIFSTAKNAVKTMSMDIMGIADAAIQVFEAYSKYDDVVDLNESYIKLIINLVRTSMEFGRPPLISFNYGNLSFVGHMSNVDVEYKRFDKNGDVVRANLKLTIEEATSEDGGADLTMGGGMGGGDAAVSDKSLDIMKALA